MSSINEGDMVIPGDSIGRAAEYECGMGTYVSADYIVSSVIGKVVCEDPIPPSTKRRINVISDSQVNSKEAVLEIGDIVMARVLRISINQTSVDILSVGDRVLRQPPKAIIRREDIRLSETDTLVMHECFRPGDIVRAAVISLGDARQYFLSTAEPEYGVVYAAGEKSGEKLVPISWKEMEDPVTKTRELRKVAKPTSV
mmetsp:Transcript_1344/g.2176  ORF Transcript_1344/g.2176 Transcript_1344/m.2176 type:complete len:199 (-) Transcript_1344:8-604(-)